jgi:hypothetical protein
MDDSVGVKVGSLEELQAEWDARHAAGHDLWNHPHAGWPFAFMQRSPTTIGFSDHTSGEEVVLAVSRVGGRLDGIVGDGEMSALGYDLWGCKYDHLDPDRMESFSEHCEALQEEWRATLEARFGPLSQSDLAGIVVAW